LNGAEGPHRRPDLEPEDAGEEARRSGLVVCRNDRVVEDDGHGPAPAGRRRSAPPVDMWDRRARIATSASPLCYDGEMHDFDLLIIGAGSAGTRCARASAALGARVAVVEVARAGGTCVNVGCVPKKLMVYASHFAEEMEQARGYGWSVAAGA